MSDVWTVGRAIYEADRAAQQLGIALVDIRPGYACMTMTIRPEMANGHGIGHGGMTFSLADTAMAYASNSRNQRAVAQSILVHFLAPAHPGDLLTATAEEINRTKRTGVYDVTVVNQTGKRIAVFRGTTHTIKGEYVPGLEII
jgi:acyl-CoA thioesterase